MRQRISGHSPYEPVFGFSRAVVAGDRVLVAGTAPVPPGGAPPPAGPYAQARLCLDLIGEALSKAGTSLDHVIRTRIYLTAAEYWEEVARAHGEIFADIRPAATAVIVAGLLDPAWLVEIEAEAQRLLRLHAGTFIRLCSRTGTTLHSRNQSALAYMVDPAMWWIGGTGVHRTNRITRIHRAIPGTECPTGANSTAKPALRGGSGLPGGSGPLCGTGSTP